MDIVLANKRIISINIISNTTQKWIRKKKEFIKLHIAVDDKSEKIVSFRITKGIVHK
jgi:hypothetical protein